MTLELAPTPLANPPRLEGRGFSFPLPKRRSSRLSQAEAMNRILGRPALTLCEKWEGNKSLTASIELIARLFGDKFLVGGNGAGSARG